MDHNQTDEIISSSLEKQLTYDKQSKKGTSYYLKEQINDDIENNTNNTNDDHITNTNNLQQHTINTSGSNGKSTEQSSREPAMKILIHLQIYRTKAVIITYQNTI